MAVTNPQAPASFNFSRNFIPLQFFSDNFLEQTGIAAVNSLNLFGSIVAGNTITLQFGTNTLVFTCSNVPDSSGLQFPPGDGLAYYESLIPYFKANHTIDQNYTVTWESSSIHFRARKKTTGLDMTEMDFGVFGSMSNDVIGIVEIARSDYYIYFELFCQTDDHTAYELVHSAQLKVNKAGLAEVDVADRLNSFIELDPVDFVDLGSIDALICKKSCRKFYYTFAEQYGQPSQVYRKFKSADYTVLAGGLSTKGAHIHTLSSLLVPDNADLTQDRFLKQGNTQVYTREDQPQFLYFFNTRTAKTARLRAKYYFTDGNDSGAVTVTTGVDLATLQKVDFNVTYNALFTPADFPGKIVARYEIWLETVAGDVISETRSYWMNYKAQQFVRYFVSWSSWGALDSRLCYGKSTSSLEMVQQEAKRIRKSGDDIKKGNSTIFDVKLNNKFKASTGHISRNELILNRDFYLSSYKFRYVGGLLLPIKVTSKNIDELADGETLFHQEFEYEYRIEDDVYTEGDVNEPGVNYDSFFFSSVNPGIPSNGLIETDPTVPSWVKSITQADINRWNLFNIAGYHNVNWDLSFAWGNHAIAGYALASNVYDKTTSDGRYIQNQTATQQAAQFHVTGGKFAEYAVLPVVAPAVPTPGSVWIGTGNSSSAPAGGPQFINDLVDVTITNVQVGHTVVWNGVAFVNQAASSGVSSWNDLTDKPTTLADYGIQSEGDARWLGISATATNAVNWNGLSSNLGVGGIGGGLDNLLGVHTNGTAYQFNAIAVQSFLGLGSAAYVNADFETTVNTVALRDSNGFLKATYYNQSSQNDEPGAISQFITTNGSDSFFRKKSVSQVQSALGLGSAAYQNTSAFLGASATAVNSTLWNGQTYTGLPSSASDYFLTNNGAVWGYASVATVQAALGLGTAAYQNTSAFLGASATAVNSTLWNGTGNGLAIDMSHADVTGLAAKHGNGNVYSLNLANSRLWLGLGSAAYLNASQSAAGSTIVHRDSNGRVATSDIVWFESIADRYLQVSGSGYYFSGYGYLGSNAFNSTAYLPLTGGTLSGGLSQINISNTNGFNQTVSSGTFGMNYMVNPTQGTALYYGIEGGVVNTVFNGTLAYAAVLGNNYNRPLQFGTNTTIRYTIDASGNNTWTGSGQFNDVIYAYKPASDVILEGGAIYMPGGYTSLRTGTDQSFNIDNYNGNSRVNALKISPGGDFTFARNAIIGGTLTGTSATFAGNVDITKANSFLDLNSTSGVSSIGFRAANTYEGYISAISGGGMFFGTGASASEKMRINSIGRVGIGTTNPSALLVISNNNNLGFEIDPTGNGGERVELLSYNRTTSAYKPIRINASEYSFEVNGGSPALTLSGTSATFSSIVTAPTFIGALTGTASTTTLLQTSRTLWGQAFNGSADITGALTGVTDITASGLATAHSIKATNKMVLPLAAPSSPEAGALWISAV
ncbi:MAG: hypothetical protein H7Y13_11800 [Sphingobacteriaceae bacterium]|nr:hypothetical protein [Sphingobacteriaceae bacterium]